MRDDTQKWVGDRRRQSDDLAEKIKDVHSDVHTIKDNLHQELSEIKTFFIQCQMNKDYVEKEIQAHKVKLNSCCEKIVNNEKELIDLKRRVSFTEKFSWGLVLALVPTLTMIVFNLLSK